MKKIIIVLCLFAYIQVTAQNVGIGINSPSEKLQVDSGDVKIGNLPWTIGNDNLLKFGDGNFVTIGEAGLDDQMELSAANFVFAGSDGAGNVGIGTATAAEKLEVAGGIKIGYTSTTNNGGSIRYNTVVVNNPTTDNIIEYNNGLGWRSMVNTYNDSALSSLTPFNSTIRNTFVSIPGVSMTVSNPGVYLVIFKASGMNNNEYPAAGANYDQNGIINFQLNGKNIAPSNRIFLLSNLSDSLGTLQYKFIPNPVEYTTVLNLNSGDVLTLQAEVVAIGTVTGAWTINEADITTVRLY